MTMTDAQIEDRLRRTFAAVADAEPEVDTTVLQMPEPRRTVGRRSVVAAAAAIAVVMGAVVVAQRDDPTSVKATGLAPAAAPDSGSVSLKSYLRSEDEAALLFRAEQRLQATCMQAAGQPYEETSPRPNSLDRYWPRLGRTDAARAKQLGYLPMAPGDEGSGKGSPSTDSLTAEQKDAWSQAFSGRAWEGGQAGPSVPLVDPRSGEETGRQDSGGCVGQMNRALYGDQARFSSLDMFVTNVVVGEVDQAVQREPALQERVESWSRCMADRGHRYGRPLDPVHEFNPPAEQPAVATDAERAVAVADVECKGESGLLDGYRDLETAVGARVAGKYLLYLEEYRTLLDAAVERARRLLEA